MTGMFPEIITFRVMYTKEFSAYKDAVVEAYLLKREEAQKDWLMRPTRYRLKQAFLQLAENGLEKRDEAMLHNYLKMGPGEGDYFKALKDRDADDFRGFEQFLHRTDKITAEKNIELLAWLIGFEWRPVEKFKKERLGVVIPRNRDEGPKPPVEPSEKRFVKKNRQWFAVIGGLIAVGLLAWLLITRDDCMYWDNDHYVATRCSVPRLDTSVVTLDAARLRAFRRLKHSDTLTTYAVRRFWYARVADSLEIYSAGGRHPLYADKKLRLVTDYVVNVCRGQTQSKSTALRDTVKKQP
jgi:hypothetical protein